MKKCRKDKNINYTHLPQNSTGFQLKKKIIFVSNKDALRVGGELVIAAVRTHRHHRVVLAKRTDAPRPTRHLQNSPHLRVRT